MFKKALPVLLITLSFTFANTADASGGKTKPKRTEYTIEVDVDSLPHPWLQWLWSKF